MCVCVSGSIVSDSLDPHELHHTYVGYPMSMGFSRQEYWSGLPFPPPGKIPYPGMEPASVKSDLHWQMDSLLLDHLVFIIF